MGATSPIASNGGLYAVRARNCILACYNRLIPYLLPEIPERQKEALAYPVKVPMVYTNVLLKRWTAFQKAGCLPFQLPACITRMCSSTRAPRWADILE